MAMALHSEWQNITQKGTGVEANFKAYPLEIPINHRPQVALASQPQLLSVVKDTFRSDHTNFWDYDGPYVDKGLKAVFLTDTGMY